ncbi:hypothetical protein, partial [Bacteroides acidifaciens]|uniref:hypothetical protein n=1 Tax=Bacteroides acidifaciens TaxID=85831 RepID=UPI0025A07056
VERNPYIFLIHSSILLIAKLTGIESLVSMKNMAEHRNSPPETENNRHIWSIHGKFAYLCSRKQGFFEMAEANSE